MLNNTSPEIMEREKKYIQRPYLCHQKVNKHLLPPKKLLCFCRQKSSQNTKRFIFYNINAQQRIARSYGKKKEVMLMYSQNIKCFIFYNINAQQRITRNYGKKFF